MSPAQPHGAAGPDADRDTSLSRLHLWQIQCVRDVVVVGLVIAIEIGRAHVWTPVTRSSRMPSSA